MSIKKWEYLHLKLDASQALEIELNKFGHEGWELGSAVRSQVEVRDQGSCEIEVILKRCVPQPFTYVNKLGETFYLHYARPSSGEISLYYFLRVPHEGEMLSAIPRHYVIIESPTDHWPRLAKREAISAALTADSTGEEILKFLLHESQWQELQDALSKEADMHYGFSVPMAEDLLREELQKNRTSPPNPQTKD